MIVYVSVNGLSETLDILRNFTSNADQIVQDKMLESVMENIVVVAKTLAPKRTGALRESITAVVGNEPMSVILSSDKLYAPFLEYGTRYIPEGKYSFLGPAIEIGKAKVVSDITDAITGALQS